MTRHCQRDEVRLDIGGAREEDETCVDENIEDKTSTWSTSRTINRHDHDLRGQDIDMLQGIFFWPPLF